MSGVFDMFKRKPNNDESDESEQVVVVVNEMDDIFDRLGKNLEKSQLHHQKIQEKSEGLRKIVQLGDLNGKNLIIRKNSIAELIDEDVEAHEAELTEVNSILRALDSNNFLDVLTKADTQTKEDYKKLLDRFETPLLKDEAPTGTRTDSVRKIQNLIKEFKELADKHSQAIDTMKNEFNTIEKKMIEAEMAKVRVLKNMLEKNLKNLQSIKTEMQGEADLEQVKRAKQQIMNMLSAFDARTSASKLNEIREDNKKIEESLHNHFTQTGGIVELEKQIEAKAAELDQVGTELGAASINIIFK